VERNVQEVKVREGGGIGGAARGARRLGLATGGPPLDAQHPGVRQAGLQAVDVGCSGSGSSTDNDEADNKNNNKKIISQTIDLRFGMNALQE
jgi:hypothetical protein